MRMRVEKGITLAALGVAIIVSWVGCATVPLTPSLPSFVNVGCGTVTEKGTGAQVNGATCTLGGVQNITNANGYALLINVPTGVQTLSVTAPDYVPYTGRYDILVNTNLPVALERAHVDPSTFTLEQIAAVRGSMWTARYPMPWGPRPGKADNILSIGAVINYPNLADRVAVYKAYTSKGYTHAAIGAWSAEGYHGQYPVPAMTFDQWLDFHQELYDNGIIPATFIKNDNMTCAELEEKLTPLYSQPRAQKLVRLAGPGGWEPSKDTPNSEWVCWMKWGARVLPNAVRFIHMEADFDAPGNNDDFTPNQPKFIGMAKAWANLAPYLHLFFNQVGGYVFGGSEVPTQEFLNNYCALFKGSASLTDRFQRGYAGWPTFSAWPSGGIRVIASEYAAYADYWKNWDEKYAQQIGDHAMLCGAAGYLDGGTLPVPLK